MAHVHSHYKKQETEEIKSSFSTFRKEKQQAKKKNSKMIRRQLKRRQAAASAAAAGSSQEEESAGLFRIDGGERGSAAGGVKPKQKARQPRAVHADVLGSAADLEEAVLGTDAHALRAVLGSGTWAAADGAADEAEQAQPAAAAAAAKRPPVWQDEDDEALRSVSLSLSHSLTRSLSPNPLSHLLTWL